MPMLIRREGDRFVEVEDEWRGLADGETPPPGAQPTIVSLTGLMDGEPAGPRRLGLRLTVEDPLETAVPLLDRLSLVALVWPKFRDGRPLTTARLLRERWRFAGEVRAVGDCRRDQAFHMVRCGFDAFEPADGATAEQWARSAGAFRHVYTRADDFRPAAFEERVP